MGGAKKVQKTREMLIVLIVVSKNVLQNQGNVNNVNNVKVFGKHSPPPPSCRRWGGGQKVHKTREMLIMLMFLSQNVLKTREMLIMLIMFPQNINIINIINISLVLSMGLSLCKPFGVRAICRACHHVRNRRGSVLDVNAFA